MSSKLQSELLLLVHSDRVNTFTTRKIPECFWVALKKKDLVVSCFWCVYVCVCLRVRVKDGDKSVCEREINVKKINKGLKRQT